MIQRRRFLKTGLAMIAMAVGAVSVWPRRAWAETGRWLIPKGTRLDSLVGRNPNELDPSGLDLTPVEDFGTMGQTDHKVDLAQWRLDISGAVNTPSSLNYEQLTSRPSFQKKVLLICPGVFAYYAEWAGLSLLELLESAGLNPTAEQVEVSGPEGRRRNSKVFPLEDIRSGKVFLAYGVNGGQLPEAHGYPLRIVAEDYYGSDWIKYVDHIRVLPATA